MTHHMRILGSLLTLVFCLQASAERFKYSELQIKDYDEMGSIMRGHIKKGLTLLKEDKDSNEGDPAPTDAVEHMRDALQFILSRPNQDNMLGKLMPEVRKELTNVNAFEDTLASLATEAVDGLKNSNLATVYRSTYLFILENILNEFKPELKEKEEIRTIFEKIRDAKVELPKDVSKDLKLRSMFKVESPSERAKRILDSLGSSTKSKLK